MIRLGLIGCGEHSEGGHAVPLARYKAENPGGIELSAVCDLKKERAELFCSKYGFARAYQDRNQMLSREKLDGCVAVVPVEKISEIGIDLLERKIPCVMEKPLGASISQVRSLLETARATRTTNMVSVNRRFMPMLNRALEWVRSAGPLSYVRCSFLRHARTEPEFLWGTAVHAVDTLRYIGGNITDVNLYSLPNLNRTANWYAIDLRFANGVLGRIDVLPTTGILEETYELFGNNFRTIITSPFGPERGWRAYRENKLLVNEMAPGTTPEDVLNGCYDEAKEFIQALSEKRAPRPSIEDVFPSVELCLSLAEKQEQAVQGLAPVQF